MGYYPPPAHPSRLLAGACRKNHRGGALDVAGLQPEATSLLQIDLHLNLRDVLLQLLLQVDEALHARKRLP